MIRWGRKPVLIVSQLTLLSTILAFGFSPSYNYALVFRFIGGLNGSFCVSRTYLSEVCVFFKKNYEEIYSNSSSSFFFLFYFLILIILKIYRSVTVPTKLRRFLSMEQAGLKNKINK